MVGSLDIDATTLIGRSVRDAKVVAYLLAHGEPEPSSVVGTAMATYGAGFGENGFSLSAMGIDGFRGDIGEPLSRTTGDPDEMIVNAIRLSDAGCAVPGSQAYARPLPFGLAFGDTAETISHKLRVQPVRKSRSRNLPDRSPIRFNWFYHIGETSVVVALTQTERLAGIYLMPMDRHDRMARDREAGLEADTSDIDPANAAAVEALKGATPLARWRDAMADGDDLFTEEIIAQAAHLLTAFIDEVAAATSEPSAPSVYAAARRVVMGLNALNEAKATIETLERDELGVFIDLVIKTSGLVLKEGEDITLQWRDY